MTLHDDYQRFLDSRLNVTPKTLRNYRQQLEQFPPQPTAEAIHEHILNRVKSDDIANATAQNDLILAKMLCDFLELDRTALDRVRVGKKREVTVDDLYTRDELNRIFDACHDTRDIALVQVLYESACRANELLSMQIEKILFNDDTTVTTIVKGKTGTREVILYQSVPALREWLNVHPHKTGPVWVSLHGDNPPLTYSGLYQVVKRAMKRAGLYAEKRHILHMFRHTRITELVKLGVRGQSLSKFVGWTKRSNMEAVYVHLSTADVQNEMREKVFGLGEGEERETRPLLDSAVCPRCKTTNTTRAVVCVQCNMPLSPDGIVKAIERKEQHLDANGLLERLREDPDTMQSLAEAIAKVMVKEQRELQDRED